jgi:hypothetical protein
MDYYTYERYDTKHGWIDFPLKGTFSLSYGDFIKCPCIDNINKKRIYIIPSYLSGGNYGSSSTIEISNHRVFLENYGKLKGIYDVCGGFDSFGVAIRLDVYESNEEIKKLINKLDDNPLISDEDLNELEMELQEKAWEDWARHDMLNLINKSHPLLKEYEAEEDFDMFFYHACNEANEYWVNEQGNTMYISLEKIVPYLRDFLLTNIVDLPLLISHEWKSERARKLFEKKLKGED